MTDVQLKYTKEGKFRKFGFVGFKTENDAQRALKSLNDTYIDTSKINVQVCAALGNYFFFYFKKFTVQFFEFMFL